MTNGVSEFNTDDTQADLSALWIVLGVIGGLLVLLFFFYLGYKRIKPKESLFKTPRKDKYDNLFNLQLFTGQK